MNPAEYVKFRNGAFHGIARLENQQDINDWLVGNTHEECVRRTKTRTVFRVKSRSGELFYIKQHLSINIFHKLASLFSRSKANREFENLRRLEELGLNAPIPVGYLESGTRSLLITKEVPNSFILKSILASRGFDPEGKRVLIQQLAKTIKKSHDAGFLHHDMHIGNILIYWEPDYKPSFCLLDVHKSRFLGYPLPIRLRLKSLASIIFSMYRFLTRQDILRFVHSYGFSKKNNFMMGLNFLKKFNHRYSLSRAKKSLTQSSVVYKMKGKRYTVIAHHDQPIDSILNYLDKIFISRPIKALADRKLVLINKECFAKIFNYKGLSGSFKNIFSNRAIKNWVNYHVLHFRNVRTPQLFALIRPKNQTIVIGRWLDQSQPLYDYIKTRFDKITPENRREFCFNLARFIRDIHDAGVFQKDLKANNILVCERNDGSVEFYLVDLDNIRFYDQLPIKAIIKNLAQLNASIGTPITITDRLRFFRYYAIWNEDLRKNDKKSVQSIMAITKKRRHIWP